MKALLIKLIIPLTVISFPLFTKWWFVLPVDAPHEIMHGFPLPYVCPGWHTSLSLQLFVLPFTLDLLVYLLFWFLVVYAFYRACRITKVNKVVVIVLYSLSGFVALGSTLLLTNPDNIITPTRDWEMDVLKTGYEFVWQQQDIVKLLESDTVKEK